MVDDICIFCKLFQQKSDIAWEGEFLFARFDLNPVSPGHSLIIPKRHVVDLADVNEGEWKEIKTAIAAITRIIEHSDLKSIYNHYLQSTNSEIAKWFINKALVSPFINTKPQAYNHGVNDGTAAGRMVHHFHWHVIPRYHGDATNSNGGVRSVIPHLKNYTA